MTALPLTTQRRLKKIPQIPSVWEGDRRPLEGLKDPIVEGEAPERGDCILWVDGSEGTVRAMDVVSSSMGLEAVVRTLLRAIENPHGYARPARPKKIVVCDREIQFFLRGALQDLGISIDYAPQLPLIDALFQGFHESSEARPPALPPTYANALIETANQLWEHPPWDYLTDNDILAITSNQWDLGTLYACVMGMLGREYGILLYRSVESLKRFRSAVLDEGSSEQLEKAFLQQDCWFLNYGLADDWEEEEADLATLPASAVYPYFGSVHPYEGLRPFLGEEEAIAVYIALQALLRFVKQSKRQLSKEVINAFSKQLSIELPKADGSPTAALVTVSTLPEQTGELFAMLEQAAVEDWPEESEQSVPIKEDLVPADALLMLSMRPWEEIKQLRDRKNTYCQFQEIPERGEGMPVVLIQTSRPKAKVLIETLQAAGGLQGIGFNPGEDPMTNTVYDLGILQAGNGDLYLFGEFDSNDPSHRKDRQLWDRRCQKTQGYCGLIIARGLKGASRGQPQLRDMMALFEAKALSVKDLGMGVLHLMSQFE